MVQGGAQGNSLGSEGNWAGQKRELGRARTLGRAALGHGEHSQPTEVTLESLAQAPKGLLVSSHEIAPVLSLI